MESKEALERIETMFPGNKEYKSNYYTQFTNSHEPFYKDFDCVMQDLERLQKLNAVFSDSHTTEIQNEFNKIECSSDKCETCPLCIGDDICIKTLFEIKWRLQGENANVRMENIKLKKVIGILEREPIILKVPFECWTYDKERNLYYYENEEYDYDYDYDDWDWVQKQYFYLKEDFDLLKEYLSDE